MIKSPDLYVSCDFLESFIRDVLVTEITLGEKH